MYCSIVNNKKLHTPFVNVSRTDSRIDMKRLRTCSTKLSLILPPITCHCSVGSSVGNLWVQSGYKDTASEQKQANETSKSILCCSVAELSSAGTKTWPKAIGLTSECHITATKGDEIPTVLHGQARTGRTFVLAPAIRRVSRLRTAGEGTHSIYLAG